MVDPSTSLATPRVVIPARRFVSWRRIGIGLFLGILSIVALFPAAIAPYDPIAMQGGSELLSPNRDYWLGTDQFGRDLLSRIIYGLRMSVIVSISAVLVGAVPGVLIGLYAGYVEGRISFLIMRASDVLLAFPPLLLAILLAAVLGPGPLNAAIALGVVSLPEFSRIVRSAVVAETQKDYVSASQSMGMGGIRIVCSDILPNITAPLIVQITLSMGAAIALEAALGFIGLGIQPPEPSLGSMLNESRKFMYQAWWYAAFPGLAISLLLFLMNWAAETISDWLNPRNQLETR